jgi:hypothetical protein
MVRYSSYAPSHLRGVYTPFGIPEDRSVLPDALALVECSVRDDGVPVQQHTVTVTLQVKHEGTILRTGEQEFSYFVTLYFAGCPHGTVKSVSIIRYEEIDTHLNNSFEVSADRRG